VRCVAAAAASLPGATQDVQGGLDVQETDGHGRSSRVHRSVSTQCSAGGRRLLGPCPHAARQLPLITDRWLACTEESETPHADSKCGRRAECVGSRGADF